LISRCPFIDRHSVTLKSRDLCTWDAAARCYLTEPDGFRRFITLIVWKCACVPTGRWRSYNKLCALVIARARVLARPISLPVRQVSAVHPSVGRSASTKKSYEYRNPIVVNRNFSLFIPPIYLRQLYNIYIYRSITINGFHKI